MFEDGVTEFIDLSKEDWEILSDWFCFSGDLKLFGWFHFIIEA